MERRAFRVSGFVVVALLFLLCVGAGVWLWRLTLLPDGQGGGTAGWVTAATAVVLAVTISGLTVVNPNEARVVLFFGRYLGSLRDAGFHFTVPLTTKRMVSLRVRNFESARLKVSDADGNPVEIAAVVVFRVVDTAKA